MKDLEQVLAQSQTELIQTFGDNLSALLVFGSAAVGDFLPGASDINLLVVLKTADLAALRAARGFRRRLAGQRVAAPLILSEEQIRNSADVFPIEFLEIREKRRLLHGRDPFARLRFGLKNLRHECEHELRGRLIRLRESYIESRPGAAALKSLLLAAHNANFPAFRAALRLKKTTPPVKKEDIAAQLARLFGLDAEVFRQLSDLRAGVFRPAEPELERLLDRYLSEVGKLVRAVDRA